MTQVYINQNHKHLRAVDMSDSAFGQLEHELQKLGSNKFYLIKYSVTRCFPKKASPEVFPINCFVGYMYAGEICLLTYTSNKLNRTSLKVYF